MDEKGTAMSEPVSDGFWRGLRYAVPPSLALWALIIWALT